MTSTSTRTSTVVLPAHVHEAKIGDQLETTSTFQLPALDSHPSCLPEDTTTSHILISLISKNLTTNKSSFLQIWPNLHIDCESKPILTYQRRNSREFTSSPFASSACSTQDDCGEATEHSPIVTSPKARDDSIPLSVSSGPRRSTRLWQAPCHLDTYIAVVSADVTIRLILDDGDNLQFHEICIDANRNAAMEDEYAIILQNDTWELLLLPPSKRVITAQWIFKVKLGSLGQPPRYKARLVVRGFQPQQGVD